MTPALRGILRNSTASHVALKATLLVNAPVRIMLTMLAYKLDGSSRRASMTQRSLRMTNTRPHGAGLSTMDQMG